jgi:hypothetical protein
MLNLNFLQLLSSIPTKITTALSLAGLVAIAILAVVQLIPSPLIGAIAIAALSLIAIAGFIAERVTPPKKESVSLSKDIRVEEEIWRNLDTVLNAIGFNKRNRSDYEELLIGKSYDFSWASAGGNKSLFIVQLKQEELTPEAIGLLHEMRGRLEMKRSEVIKKIVIIYNVPQIFDWLHYVVIGREDLALLTRYSINEIKKDNVDHLKKLLL